MTIHEWFQKKKQRISSEIQKRRVPNGLWIKCEGCGKPIFKKELEKNLKVCPKCNFHFRLTAKERIDLLIDPDSFKELDVGILSIDPLDFKDTKLYKDRLRETQASTGLKEAVVTGIAKIDEKSVILAVMDFEFIGGSMGSVVGEKIARAIELAIKDRKPLIIVSTSGGARMQEGIFSLMQMVKTSAAIQRLHDSGIFYLSILTDPTYGGVLASFASLADVIIAEPSTRIGFAGPDVIRRIIKQKLPEGFQKAEFLLEHGMIDMIVPRPDLKPMISKLLNFFEIKEVESDKLQKIINKMIGIKQRLFQKFIFITKN